MGAQPFHATAAEMLADRELEPVHAREEFVARQQGRIGAAVCVGVDRLDRTPGATVEPAQRHLDARRRQAEGGIEHMRGQSTHDGQPLLFGLELLAQNRKAGPGTAST